MKGRGERTGGRREDIYKPHIQQRARMENIGRSLEMTSPIRKWAKDIRRLLIKVNEWMANKHIKMVNITR